MLQAVNPNTNNNFSISNSVQQHFEIDDLYQLVRYAHFDDRQFKRQRFDQQKLLTNQSIEKLFHENAIEFLTTDHQYLSDLFTAYANLSKAKQDNSVEKAHLIAEICVQLSLHTQIEESVFYPAARTALLNEGFVMNEPIIEYAGLMALIADVEHDQLRGKNCEKKIQVLSEYWNHHVKQDQDELFPQLVATGIDLQALGQKIALEKQVLNANYPTLVDENSSRFKGLS